jgi:flagellar biogenesis protein FliO
MLGILIVLLGGLYLGLYLIRRISGVRFDRKSSQLLQVLCIRHVGVKKQVALVQVPGALLVLGLSGDHIQLLDKIAGTEPDRQVPDHE